MGLKYTDLSEPEIIDDSFYTWHFKLRRARTPPICNLRADKTYFAIYIRRKLDRLKRIFYAYESSTIDVRYPSGKALAKYCSA